MSWVRRLNFDMYCTGVVYGWAPAGQVGWSLPQGCDRSTMTRSLEMAHLPGSFLGGVE